MSIADIKAGVATGYKLLTISSDVLKADELLPAKYSCEGMDVNPPLSIQNIPETAKSLAIIVDDPDAPNGIFCHWVIWNIPVTHQIKEGENRGRNGVNDFIHNQYSGPCPPSGTHRYNFKVYALDCTLSLPVSSAKMHLEKAMADHVIGFGVLTVKYKRQRPLTR